MYVTTFNSTDQQEIINYRDTVHLAHNKFAELKKLLQEKKYKDASLYINLAYKSFEQSVFKDIQNNSLI